MKNYSVEAKTSKESVGNTFSFYKEEEKIWLSFPGTEERGFTIDEAKEILVKLDRCIQEN